jgi:exosome complex RNA-binding protein Csl4
MITLNQRTLLIVLGTAAVSIVTTAIVQHQRDAGRDRELLELHGRITADSVIRALAVAKTDADGSVLDTAVRAAAHADSSWHAATGSARAHVGEIVASTKPDTVKIAELVDQVDTLIVKGDSLAGRVDSLRAAAVNFRVAVGVERASWEMERKDQATALAVSETRHRHWGLGATAGATLVRTPDGQVRAGPGITLGLTFRW